MKKGEIMKRFLITMLFCSKDDPRIGAFSTTVNIDTDIKDLDKEISKELLGCIKIIATPDSETTLISHCVTKL